MSNPLQILAIIWASPYSLIGVLVGCVGLCTGGRARRRGRTIEFYGGAVKWLINLLPNGQFVLGCTLGHTILGQSGASLDIAREHELVHVRQFERWGPFMGPAYGMASLVMWISGRRAYRDNPFEREAYAADELVLKNGGKRATAQSEPTEAADFSISRAVSTFIRLYWSRSAVRIARRCVPLWLPVLGLGAMCLGMYSVGDFGDPVENVKWLIFVGLLSLYLPVGLVTALIWWVADLFEVFPRWVMAGGLIILLTTTVLVGYEIGANAGF